MFKNLILSAFVLVVGGCTSSSNPAPSAQQLPAVAKPRVVKLTSAQELTKYCRVCVVDKGEKMEEYLPNRLNVSRGGHTYKFCSEPCRSKFDAKPNRYALK